MQFVRRHLRPSRISRVTVSLVHRREIGNEELGYTPNYSIRQHPEVYENIAACNFFGPHYYGVSKDEASRPGNIEDAIKNRGVVDCGDNEDLFLALAALRDDTDVNQ